MPKTYRKKNTEGFTLLIAVITTSLLLLISFAVVNIAVRQLVISNSGVESQYAFYVADSGIECAAFWDLKNPGGTSAFSSVNPTNIKCNGEDKVVGGVGGGGGSPFTFGNTNIGGTNDTGDSNHLNASRFTMGSVDGTVTSMSVYITSPIDNSPNNLYQLAIYSDSSGVPGTLIAQSSSQTITANTWNTASISASLSANSPYWLVYNSNGSSDTFNNLALSSGGSFAWKSQSFGAWPNSYSPDGSSSNSASIYATLTSSSGGAVNPANSFRLNFSKGCVDVEVTKSGAGATTIVSRGYNTCTPGAVRRIERGITLTY